MLKVMTTRWSNDAATARYRYCPSADVMPAIAVPTRGPAIPVPKVQDSSASMPRTVLMRIVMLYGIREPSIGRVSEAIAAGTARTMPLMPVIPGNISPEADCTVMIGSGTFQRSVLTVASRPIWMPTKMPKIKKEKLSLTSHDRQPGECSCSPIVWIGRGLDTGGGWWKALLSVTLTWALVGLRGIGFVDS